MYAGVDIGGTKCAVILADAEGRIQKKVKFATTTRDETLARILAELKSLGTVEAVGISCGGPLDEERGLILSPPNLPGWDNVPICKLCSEVTGTPAYLCNDADACAIAEWQYGAGRGTENMIFLTFGTGLGAGLILNGRRYRGAGGNAGEAGHIRLAPFGPVGYGKQGSFEGFCSGGGLRQLGQTLAREALGRGAPAAFCPTIGDLDGITAATLAEAADAGDPIAREAYNLCAEKLGEGLSILIDLLNPEVIVLGSIYARAEHLLAEGAARIIQKEALPQSAAVCRVVPAALGEQIGDLAAIAVARGLAQKGD